MYFLLQFQTLQQQVGVLQDSAHQTDERYARAKADNAALQARVIMLEEQLRDTEMRHEERLQVLSYFFSENRVTKSKKINFVLTFTYKGVFSLNIMLHTSSKE